MEVLKKENKKYNIVDEIIFKNNNAVYDMYEYNNYSDDDNYGDYVLYYDTDLILYDVANLDKKVINVNYEKYFTRENFDGIQWSVNEKENGDIVGVALSSFEMGADDEWINKGFYYNFETGKTVLENEYLVISATNNSNYLQLALTSGQIDNYSKIYDIKNNKVIYSLDSTFESLYIYNRDGKQYLLGYTLYDSDLVVFDEKMNIVNTVSFPWVQGDEICQWPGAGDIFGDYDVKTGNYVLPKNGKF